MRTTDRGVELKSAKFEGKKIALGVCGGIGSVEVVKIIREIRRHGASVQVFLTPSVSQFVQPQVFSWACDADVVEQANSDLAYLEDFDMVVVVPTTLNTLVKVSQGLSDNPVTLLVAAQLGAKRPVLIYPTMNERLAQHPNLAASVERLTKWGARVVQPDVEEGRWKVPSTEQVVLDIGAGLDAR